MNTISTRLYKSPFPSYIAGLEPRYIFDAAAAAAGAEMAADLAAQSEAEGQISLALYGGDSAQSVAMQSLRDQSIALGLAASSDNAPGSGALIFVDANLGEQEIQTLQDGLPDNAFMHLINGDSDALGQMAAVLEGYQGIQALHIVSHGSAGVLSFGAADVDFNTLNPEQVSALGRISTRIADHSDILIYGCDFAAGEVGQNAVAQLARLTNADIAASDDATGSAELGADWELEVATGDIEAVLPFDSRAQENFSIVLNSIISHSSSGAKLWLDADDKGKDDSIWQNKGNDSSITATLKGSAPTTTVMNGKQALVFNDDLYYATNLERAQDDTAIVIHQPGLANATVLSPYSEGALNIGADAGTTPQNTYTGNIAEVMIFGRTLSQAEFLVVQNSLSAKWAQPIDAYEDFYEGDDQVRGDFDAGVVGILNHSTSKSTVLDNASAGLRLSTEKLELGQSVFMGHRPITAPEHSSDREWFVSALGGDVPVKLSFSLAETGLGSTEGTAGEYRLVKFNGSSWGLVAQAEKSALGMVAFHDVVLQDKGIYRVIYDVDTAIPRPAVKPISDGAQPRAQINIQLQGADGQFFRAGSRAAMGFETIRQAENLNGASIDASSDRDDVAELEELTTSTQQNLSVQQAEKALKVFADKPEMRVEIVTKIQNFLDAKETVLGIKERDMLGELIRLAMEQEQLQETQVVVEATEPPEPVTEPLQEVQTIEIQKSVELADIQLFEPELEPLEELQVAPIPVEEVAAKELLTPLVPTEEPPVELGQANQGEQEFTAQLHAATGLQQKSNLLIHASAA